MLCHIWPAVTLISRAVETGGITRGKFMQEAKQNLIIIRPWITVRPPFPDFLIPDFQTFLRP